MAKHCKACNDRFDPDHPARKDWPESDLYCKDDYCRECYFELVADHVDSTREINRAFRAWGAFNHIASRQREKMV